MFGTLAHSDLKRGLATISAVSTGAEAGTSLWANAGQAMMISLTGLLDLLGDGGPGAEAREEARHGG
jgi:hypothetical protein